MIKKFLKQLTPGWLFIYISLINILILIILLFISNGTYLGEIVWDARHDMFIDFTGHMNRMREWRPYNINDYDARFPAFAYTFYGIMGRIIPESIADSDVNTWYYLFISIILCISVMGICFIIPKYLKKESSPFQFWIMTIIILSQPFAFAVVKAGNSTVYVLTVILFALYLKDSNNLFYRESALILIAVAAGFKITPAILGILYLKEKRYKEAFRLIIYGILFFFVPFIFVGGVQGFKDYLNIFTQVTSVTSPRPETIVGVVLEIADVTGLGAHLGLILGNTITIIYGAAVLLIFWFTKRDWKSMALLMSLLMVVINESRPYVLIYLAVPILYYIKEIRDGYGILDYCYMAIMALILTTLPILKIDWPTATFITNYFCVYVLLFMLLIDKAKEVLWSYRISQ